MRFKKTGLNNFYILLVVIGVFFLGSFLLSGYSSPRPHAYFTIHCADKKITVTDNNLMPEWYNLDSKQKFKPIYDRLEDYQAETFAQTYPELYYIVKKLAAETDKEPFDGIISFSPNQSPKFQVIGAREGYSLDTVKLCSEILTALKSGKHTDIIAPINVIQPKPAELLLEQKVALRGVFSTRFDSGNHTRAENIERSAESFNGVVIAPGQRLSFNKTVGPRTTDRGYEEANIIIDGEFVKGVGGGVCQTSTTLFNAAMLSGVHIYSSRNHSLPVAYVPLGRDAMVSSVSDLVLENNTGSNIYIESETEGSRITFKIYGARLKGITYSPHVELLERITPDGDTVRTTHTYIEVFKGSRLVNRQLVRKSTYKEKKPDVITQPEITN